MREAMRTAELAPFGGNCGTVEVDATFIGRVKGAPNRRAFHHKMKLLSLVGRESGKVCSMVIVSMHPKTNAPIVRANVATEARLTTAEDSVYAIMGEEFDGGHGVVRHGQGEYGRDADHERNRRLLQHLQAGHEGCLSALRGAASAPLPRRV